MQGAQMVRRIGGLVVVSGVLAVGAAAPASAMIAPACDARLVPAATGPSGSCSFDSNTDWALIAVQPAGGAVTATLRCYTPYGYTTERSRTFSSAGTWSTSAVGSCTLTLTGDASTVAANASATPMVPPIYNPPPPAA
jgi:hypothetical protein